ncbi:MAG TPA: hypothetical protein VMF08_11165 [Candidatus Sulfotelmatobacter sp.]|nr:hypothetical protein [Candidatus Sulfotelmatobacter sp.]
MIRKFIEKRKAKRTLEKFANAEQVEKLLHGGPESAQYHHGPIEFIIIFIRGESPGEVSKRTAQVTDLANVYGATIHHIVGALVIAVFGVPTAPAPEARKLLVQSLQHELPRDIKIIHGAANGHYGLFGKEPTSYTFLVPQFDRILGKLSQLEFGHVAEFP